MICLGIDAICWHARLARREVTLQQVIGDVAGLNLGFLQVHLDYVEAAGGSTSIIAAAQERGIELLASGGPIGQRAFNGSQADAVKALSKAIAEAHSLGSPTLMVHSGVYRPDLAGNPAAIEAELHHLKQVLQAAGAIASDYGMTVLLENSSDFKTAELLPLFESTSETVGAFLDVTNPYNVWDDPAQAIAQLAKHANAGHVKDFVLSSHWNEDHFHRYGYSVKFKYPGEGISDLPALLQVLDTEVADRSFLLSIEGLDNHAGVDDQLSRLKRSVEFVGGVLDGLVI